MKKETLYYIRKYHMAEPGDGVIVGLSGGADSVCLLRVLWCLKEELQISLRAVHVHHGLRGEEADRDASFAMAVCRELDVPLKTVRIKAAEEAGRLGISVEEAGRRARYQILEQEACQWEEQEKRQVRIATAHHKDDNAETILHNLFRGTGLKGLAGIAPVRGRIIRPFLQISRKEILEWLEESHFSYVEDSTNHENEYTRNRIRNELIPNITGNINSQAVQNILRAGERIGEADRYLEKKAREWVTRYAKKQMPTASERFSIPVPEFLKEDDIIQGYIVRCLLTEQNDSLQDITARHVESILELAKKGTGKEVNLPDALTVRTEYSRLVFARGNQEDSRAAAPQVDFQVFPYQNHREIPKNQYTKWFDYDKIEDTLSVRKRRTGDYITLASGGRKTVKAFMIDEKIPRERRDEIYLLAEGSHVLWIIGYRISEYYKITEQTKNILQVQLDGGMDSGR